MKLDVETWLLEIARAGLCAGEGRAGVVRRTLPEGDKTLTRARRTGDEAISRRLDLGESAAVGDGSCGGECTTSGTTGRALDGRGGDHAASISDDDDTASSDWGGARRRGTPLCKLSEYSEDFSEALTEAFSEVFERPLRSGAIRPDSSSGDDVHETAIGDASMYARGAPRPRAPAGDVAASPNSRAACDAAASDPIRCAAASACSAARAPPPPPPKLRDALSGSSARPPTLGGDVEKSRSPRAARRVRTSIAAASASFSRCTRAAITARRDASNSASARRTPSSRGDGERRTPPEFDIILMSFLCPRR